jgi:hypothetical protein
VVFGFKVFQKQFVNAMGNTKNKQKRARLVFKSLAKRQLKFVSNVKSFEVQRRRENAWERQR